MICVKKKDMNAFADYICTEGNGTRSCSPNINPKVLP